MRVMIIYDSYLIIKRYVGIREVYLQNRVKLVLVRYKKTRYVTLFSNTIT